MYHFSIVIVFVLVKFLTSMPRSRENGVFVISCEDDKSVCRKPMEAGIPVVSAEVLLTGVLRQELSLEEYPFLCKVSVKSGLGLVLICLASLSDWSRKVSYF